MNSNFPTHSSYITPPPSKVNTYIIPDTSLEIPVNKKEITRIEHDINQMPSKGNDFTGICHTTIATKTQSFSNIGVATSMDVDGKTDPKKIIAVATYIATQEVISMMNAFNTEPHTEAPATEADVTPHR